MKKLLALSLLALLSVALFSPITAHCPEATGRRPLWIEKLPNNTNDSYFEVIRAEGRTLEQARENAGTEIFTRRSGHTGRAGQIHSNNDERTFRSNDELVVRYRILCEHIEKAEGNKFNLWQLVEIGRRVDEILPPIPSKYFNSLQSAERRTLFFTSLVLGMAQIRRGSNGKGVFFIITTSTLAGAIVVTEVFRADNVSKVSTTFNVAKRQTYINNANSLQNWRNISIAATGAVYLWNIIDGLVGRNPSSSAKATYSDFRITPYADLNGTGGLILSLDF